MKPSKADTVRVPGLLDQYRQQRRAWLAQADELVRMRDEVRLAAEHEALEIVTAARRDVRRIIVEARRELLVLTAQLHAAVEATDDRRLEGPTLAPLLADPDDRSRFDAATGDPLDHTRDIVLSARKEVRSVLGEARAEIEALSSEAPAALGAIDTAIDTDTGTNSRSAQRGTEPGGVTAGAAGGGAQADDGPVDEGPVHELNLDADLTALDFQSRDLPIPTLAGILGGTGLGTNTGTDLGTDNGASDREQELTGGGALDGPVFDPASLPPYGTPRLSELRNLLREPLFDDRPQIHAFDVEAIELLSAGSRPAAAVEAREDGEDPGAPAPGEASAERQRASDTPFGVQEFTPPSRLFMSDDTRERGQGRSARTFVGLFAATGALALVATAWWAFARTSAEPLSAATPPVIESAADAAPAASATISPAAAKPPESLSLSIEARRASWIRALVDGKDEAGRIYAAGETRHIEGAQTVLIRAGDAGAVFVGVDGAPAQALGANGGPATKQFAKASAGAGAAPAVNAAPVSNAPGSPTAAPATVPPPATPIAQAAARRPDSAAPAGAAPQSATAPTNETAPAAVDNTSAGRPDLVQAGQQWLDAYQRRDRDAMASSGTENITVSDERSVTERFAAWQSSVRRDLDQVELELTGDTALLTARMTERTDGAQAAQHISRVSQIWVRRSGRWRLADVRIIGEARLNQIVR